MAVNGGGYWGVQLLLLDRALSIQLIIVGWCSISVKGANNLYSLFKEAGLCAS